MPCNIIFEMADLNRYSPFQSPVIKLQIESIKVLGIHLNFA